MKFNLITILSAASLASALPSSEPLFSRQAAQSIDAAMKAKGRKYFGTATDQGRLTTGSNAAIIKANFGQVTPENRYTYLIPFPSLVPKLFR
jgi:endo-1,4-beta-xylanase